MNPILEDTKIFTASELAKIKQARAVARFLHAGQTYDDHDYVFHLDAVVDVLLRFKYIQSELIVAAFLHDTIEDTQATFSLIEEYFGTNVMLIVKGVTNELGVNRKERNLKTYLKLREDQEALTVKLADRIANMEHSEGRRNARFFKMYVEEYPLFRHSLYNPNQLMPKALWEHLDTLVKKPIDIE